ncbi:SusC/RagA family TonB-linked outer membrane protein [Flavobacterium sp. 25HG05S-40]|uniref:SusC/RagA family TonB-linked outer membrane protein n=1 Tax=Flavobacterium sp. 25HG05S-40 TaxID=3458682 RepID=UPI004043A68E
MKTKLNGFLTLFIALLVQISFAQDRVVTGVVSDNSGLPLPGVNVLVKGTNLGTQTDFDGKFSIKATASQTLVFNFVGMKTQEVAASSTTMKVKMKDDAVELEGVVVTALGVKRQKRALGSATASVSGKDLTEVNNTNIFESLSGKVAGVDITAPAQVGASSKVVIRGYNTFGNASPLYVVDGTPITNGTSSGTGNTRSFDAGNGISDIDPNNIENMTILKGAAASALYGSRASNGVILITTKSGKNKSKITVETSHSADFSNVARVPKFQNEFGQGWNAHSWSNWAGQPGNTASNENGSWGPAFNGEVRPWGAIINNAQQIKPYVALEDNMKDFYEQGSTFTNTARVSGGGENSNFSISFSDVNSDGIIPTNADSFKRRTFGVNGGMTGDKLSFKASVNFVKKDQNAVNTGQGTDAGEGNTFSQEILQVPRDISVIDLADYTNNPYNNNSNYFTPYATNPYWSINENSTFIEGNRFYGNTNLTYNFNKKLSLSYQIGGDYKLEKVKSYGAKVTFDPGSPQADGGANAVVGGVTESSNEFIEFDTNLILYYNTKVKEDFNINAFGGFGTNERKTSVLLSSITNLDIPYFYELSNSSVKPQVAQNDLLRRGYSIFGSFEASYKDRLYLTLTGRNDWTSTLPKGANSYFYPSASLSAIAVDSNDYFLKFRAGYAKLANDTGPYQTSSALTQGNAFLGFGNIFLPIGGVNGYEYLGNLGNQDLVPEFVTEIELGFETSLFKKRVNLDAAIYSKKTDGLLVNLPIPTSTGYATQTKNAVDLTNKGIELVLTLIPIRTDNFQWDFTTTFTKNNSEVTDVIGDTEKVLLAQNYGVSFNAVVGQPLGVFSTFTPTRNDAGQYIVDGDGYYVESPDEQIVGSSERDFVMGFKNKFTYKNLVLSFGFDWKQGGEMYSYTKRLSYFTGNGIETVYNDRNPFIIPNSVVDNGDGTYSENTTPITFEGVTDFYNTQSNPGREADHVIDKTFVRLRDISLTYSLPSKLLKNTGITGASFTIYGKNLALWTPDDNSYVDPELSTFGTGLLSEQGEFGTNPSQSSYGATLKLTF